MGTDLYKGSLNHKSLRHGYGILYTKQGDKFEGLWQNDKFIKGYCIFKEGTKIMGTYPSGNLSDIYDAEV